MYQIDEVNFDGHPFFFMSHYVKHKIEAIFRLMVYNKIINVSLFGLLKRME